MTSVGFGQKLSIGLRSAPRLEELGAILSASAVVWQRLMFERVLDLPPLPVVCAFWLIFCLFLGYHLLSGTPSKRLVALVLLASAILHLRTVGLPLPGPGPELEEVRWRLAGLLSSTWHGLPLSALLAAVSVLAWAWLSAQSIRSRPLALGVASVVLLFGATTVLGYATGSPWPFGV